MRNPARRIYDHHKNRKGSKTKKLTKLFILIVFLFIIGNLLVRLPSLFKNLNKPFDKIQSKLIQEGSINDEYRTNILLFSISSRDNLQDLALASFSPSKNAVSIIRIPISVQSYSIGTDEFVSLGAAYFAKPYVDSGFDSAYIISKETLAIPIDGYFVFREDRLEFDEKTVRKIKEKLYSPGFFFRFLSYKNYLDKHMNTNYSISKLWPLSWNFKEISAEKLKVSDLKEAAAGKQFKQSDTDNFLRGVILDNSIVNEASLVEVVGEATVSNLISRVVNNLGGSTINFGDDVHNYPETKVILGSDNSKIAKRVARFIGVEVEKGVVPSGADVQVVIGDDFGKIFFGR